QVANGILLPFVLIFVVMLINDRDLMGRYTNSRWYNVVSWTTVGVMIGLTVAMVIAQIRGGDAPPSKTARLEREGFSRVEREGFSRANLSDVFPSSSARLSLFALK